MNYRLANNSGHHPNPFKNTAWYTFTGCFITLAFIICLLLPVAITAQTTATSFFDDFSEDQINKYERIDIWQSPGESSWNIEGGEQRMINHNPAGTTAFMHSDLKLSKPGDYRETMEGRYNFTTDITLPIDQYAGFMQYNGDGVHVRQDNFKISVSGENSSEPENALVFDDTAGFVDFQNHSPGYNHESLTIEAWIKTESTEDANTIVSWGNDSGSTTNVQFRTSDGKLQLGIDPQGFGWSATTSSRFVSTGEWTHVAVVKNGVNIKLYVNGINDADGSNFQNPDNAGGVQLMRLGIFLEQSWSGPIHRYFKGKIDDVRIWHTARTEEEIRANMMRVLTGEETGLKAYYTMNHSPGTNVLTDRTGNEHHGTLTDMNTENSWVESDAFTTWTGSISSDWNEPENWYNGVPVRGKSAGIYPGEYPAELSLSPSVHSLYIGEGATLSLPYGSVLSIGEQASLLNDGTLFAMSGSFLNNQGYGNPHITVQRHLEGSTEGESVIGEGWRYLSSPVTATLSELLSGIWTQGLSENPSSGKSGSGIANVYRWGDESGRNRDSWQPIKDLDVPIQAGDGFLVYVYADDNFDGNPDPFPKSLLVSGTEFENGSIAATNQDDDNGWTLMGNPFATAIQFSELHQGKNISESVYVWAPDNQGSVNEDEFESGSWVTYNSNNNIGDLKHGLIAPFQAFFIENSGEKEITIDFTNSMKSADIDNTVFLFKQYGSNTIRLELSGRGLHNSAWLRFSDDGTADQRTSGDTWQLEPMSAEHAILATEKPGVGLLDIGHYPKNSKLHIPLMATATRAGIYTLEVTDYTCNNISLWLHDLHTGQYIPLTKGMSYEFTIHEAAKAVTDPFALLDPELRKQASSGHRFVISNHHSQDNSSGEIPASVALNQNYPNPFNPSTVISYDLPETARVLLEVFDITGRQVSTLVDEMVHAGSHRVIFDAGNLSSGVYIYRLQAGQVILARRLTLVK